MNGSVLPFGCFNRATVEKMVYEAVRQPSQRKRQGALLDIIRSLVVLLEEIEEVVDAASQQDPEAPPVRLNREEVTR